MDACTKRTLPELREEIDRLDAELVALLSRRIQVAKEVGAIKQEAGKPFFVPERERDVFERLDKINSGPLQTRQLVGIFREIISAARAAEKPLAISYWGPAGSFSHLASIRTFGSSSDHLSQDSISAVFDSVEKGEATYGIVPVENSIAGMVPETLDQFPLSNCKICAELYLPVHHCLASLAQSLDDVERVYAGPQPAQQCRAWLRTHLPDREIIEVMPTSRAAERAKDDPAGAAIVNRMCAEMADLPLLAENIEDQPQNRTRFFVIGFNEPACTNRDKTTLMFNLHNRPGELVRALTALQDEGINLHSIESRPAPRAAFEYIFYVDCAGHRHDEPMCRAIERLRSLTLETVVLGSYPAADPLPSD